MKSYFENEVREATLEYFGGDALATDVWVKKYALKEGDEFLELTPQDMHLRLASEFARIEKKYPNPLPLNDILTSFENFKHIVPQGSPMSGIGNGKPQSLSNCVVIDSPGDSMSSIVDTAKDMANLFKNRCVSENDFCIEKTKGIIKLKNVNVGDYVYSFNIDTRQDEYRKVIDKFDTEVDVENRIIVKTNSGKEIRTSKTHPILTFDISNDEYLYKNAGELIAGDILITTKSNVSELINKQTVDVEEKDISWFIGTHLADGNSGKVKRGNKSSYRMRIVSATKEQVCKYKDVHKSLTGSKSKIKLSTRKDYKSDVWDYTSVKLSNKDLIVKYLDGQSNNKTYTCFIPSYVTDDKFISFLGGLIDGDGTIKNGKIQITLTSQRMISDISRVLSKYGVLFYTAKRVSSIKNEADGYSITILDNVMNTAIKQCMVVSHKANTSHNDSVKTFPMTKREVDMIRSEYHESKIIRTNNLSVQLSELKHKMRISKRSAALYKTNGLSSIDFDAIFQRLVVKSVDIDNDTDKYIDLSVEHNNNFYAGTNAFINIHNCGVGISISNLRPDGAKVSNSAGTSSGAWSFADFYSNVTRMVGQNSRRGALMISINVNHPDAESFITMKHNKTRVTGANISVQISNEFMEAVGSDSDFIQKFPVDHKFSKSQMLELENIEDYGELVKLSGGILVKKIKAKKLWEVLVNSATKTAEPGILFWDEITKMLPAHEYEEFETLTTNPCGELPLSKGDSCRLLTINLSSMVKNPFTENALFDIELFAKIVNMATRLGDDLVDLEIEKLTMLMDGGDDDEVRIFSELLEKAKRGRRIGLGTHGLADAMAKLGIVYGSDESLNIIDSIYGNLRNVAYSTSIDLGVERGTFPAYDYDTEKDNAFLKNLPAHISKKMEEQGRRNISMLTNAPTGSVSILSQTSSGIEPVFQNSYKRRRKVNVGEVFTDDKIFTAEDGEKYIEYDVFHHNANQYLLTTNNTSLPEYFIEAGDINPSNRIDVQSRIQVNIDHSISSCLVGSTLIDTNKGLKKIADIVNPDGVDLEIGFRKLTEPLKVLNHNNKIVDVSECYYNGEKEVFSVNFIGGKNIKATDNHKFYTVIDGSFVWTQLKDLRVGDHIVNDASMIVGENINIDITTYADTVKSISSHGIEPTYDISVPDGNSYIANGLIVHNTINLPKETTPQQVSQIYMESWKKKLKGVTVYVDGSREGVLIKNNEDSQKFTQKKYTVRPDKLYCDIHHRIVEGEHYIILVSILNGRPYEVFAGRENKFNIPKVHENGFIVRKEYKTKTNRYDLEFNGDGLIKDIVEVFDNPTNSTLSRMVSLSLRYGGQVQHVVEQLQQTHAESSMNCFSKVLSRVLKEYIPNGTNALNGKLCPECEQDSLVYEEGCMTCKSCGWSKCS